MLRIRIGDRDGALHPNPMVLGRSPPADWDLELTAGPERHAQLEVRTDWSLWIRALDPWPGTGVLVNGIVIEGSVRVRLGDRVELGPFPPWCRPGASAPVVIPVAIDGLDTEHRVRTEAGVSVLVALPPRDLSGGAPKVVGPAPVGSVQLALGALQPLASLVQVHADLRVEQGRGPALFSAPVLTTVARDLRLEGCSGVRRIEFAELTTVDGHLIIDRLPDLEELSLPRLHRVGAMTIRSTEWLSSVVLPSLADVQEDLTIVDNGLLTHVALPRLRRARRVRIRRNRVLPESVPDALRADLRRRRADGVVDAANNGWLEFAQVIRHRLHAFGSSSPTLVNVSFERFVRVAPELIEVHERMLLEADRDGDKTATIERLRRLLELARAQGDDRETEYDAAIRYLLDPVPNEKDVDAAKVAEWTMRLTEARRQGPMEGDDALWWLAELSAVLERLDDIDAPSLLATWKARGARILVAPQLAELGYFGLASRSATQPADPALGAWLWAAAHRSTPVDHNKVMPPVIRAASVTLGRLLVAASVTEAADAFMRLAEDLEQGFIDAERTVVSPARRAAGEWLAEDIVAVARSGP